MAMSRAGRKRVILVAMLLAAAGAAAGAYGLRQAQIRRNMERWLAAGTAAHERGDYQAALENLNKYISRNKRNPQALIDFADARRRVPAENNQHINSAIRIVQTALALEPDSPEARVMLMELYATAGLSTEARDAAEGVLDLDPASFAAHLVRLDALTAAGRNSEIAAAARRMAEAIPGDLGVQREALLRLISAEAPTEELRSFMQQCEGRFEPQIGLELMRAIVAGAESSRARRGSDEEARALDEHLRHLGAAAEMEVHDAEEARMLITMLEAASRSLPQDLAENTLARLMEDPGLAEKLAPLAAERAWARGQEDAAGSAIVDNVANLETAEDIALGWLSISAVPEAEAARRILAARTSPKAAEWCKVAEAKDKLDKDEPLAASATLTAVVFTDRTTEAVATHLLGRSDFVLGETARAADRWSRLLEARADWHRVRAEAARAYISLGRLDDAAGLLLLPGGTPRGLLPLEVLVRLAEREPAEAARAASLAEQALEQSPDLPNTQLWAARAFLVAGQHDRAGALVDSLIKSDLTRLGDEAAELAMRLEKADPSRAAALRDRVYATAPDASTAVRLALLDAAAGRTERGRALLEQGVRSAEPADLHRWRLSLAAYLDVIGDPQAGPMLLGLSEETPEDLLTQQIVLNADSVWHDPAALEPVIGRLRTITGRQGIQWQVFDAKRQLLMIEDGAADADERATGIVLSLTPVLQADPQNLLALDTAAAAASIVRDNARAADYLLRAVRADPVSFSRRLRLLDALASAGRIEEARQHARDLTELSLEGADDLRARATALNAFGLRDLARPDWERLSVTGDPLATVELAGALADRGDVARADEMVESILALPTLDDTVLIRLSDYFARRGDPGRGLEVLGRLPERGQAGSRNELHARYLFLATEGPERARRIEELAKECGEGLVWAYAALAYQFDLGETESRRVVGAGLAVAPDSPDLLAIRRMHEASAAGEPMAHLALMRSILKLQVSPETRAIISVIDDRLDGRIDDERLVARLAAIASDAPLSRDAWLALATAQFATGHTDDMRTTLLRALEAIPTSPSLAGQAVSLFKQAGMPEDALFATRAWRNRAKAPAFDVALSIAGEFGLLNRYDEALPVLEPWRPRIDEEGAQYPERAYLLAFALAANGKIADADALISPLLGSAPNALKAYVLLNEQLRDTTQRRGWLTRTTPLALESGQPEVLVALVNGWHSLAVASRERDDVVECARVAEEAIARAGSPLPAVSLTAAVAYDHLGDPARAIPHYRAVLEQAPDERGLHNNLAYALFVTGAEPAEALSHADRAIELAQAAGAPPHEISSYLDTRGRILLAAGRAAEAVETYGRALEPDENWPVGLVGLAEALLAAGQRAEAREAIERLDAQTLSDVLRPRVEAIRQQVGSE